MPSRIRWESLHMAETNNVDIASIMNMVATLSPEGSGARKDVTPSSH